MSIRGKYMVSSIDHFQCREWLMYKHYAKSIPSISYSFGLYCDNDLVGVITFGTPFVGPLQRSFEGFKMIELNRLITNEGLQKNALSFFVSQSLKKLPKPLIVISYADSSQNHNGYIYQATNFIYTGLSAKRKDWKIKGLEHLHGGTIADKSYGKENRANYMRKKYGDRFYLKDRPRKHRYFYFIGSKYQKRQMISLLPYEIEPYPKGKNERYDTNYKPVTQGRLF